MNRCTGKFRSLILLLPFVLPRASAEPVTYTLTGYVQASINDGAQASWPFVWTVAADTADITSSAPGHYQNRATSSSISIYDTGGVLTALHAVLYNVTVYLDTTTGEVMFSSAAGGIGLTNSGLQAWNLRTPLGPLEGPNPVMPGDLTTDTVATITLDGMAGAGSGPSPTFQASLPPPTVASVQNAASNIPPGLPNSAIAQGAIFAVYGSALGPPVISVAPSAFQSISLSDTSVAVTVNGITVNALMYYTSAGQAAALLPSNTPAGTGSLTVTYNGRTSVAVPVTVVSSNIGIFTIGSSGTGPGIVTYPDYSLVSPIKASGCGGAYTTCGAANPGDTLTLWATGLGPVAGNDASGAGLGQSLPNPPLTLWVGGVQAPVAYRGRSGCCIGEDQVVFTVPANAPAGCAVPVVIQTGGLVSNTVSMPVAKGSRNCTPGNAALASVDLRRLTEAGPINYANIMLRTIVGTWYSRSDLAQFQFARVLSYQAPTQPFLASYLDDMPPGTCTTYTSLPRNDITGLPATTTAADGGTSFTVTGPNGSMVLTGNPGQFNAVLAAAGGFLSPGEFTITGAGGADIGNFSAPFPVRGEPDLTYPATHSLPPVTRSEGLTVTWVGGYPDAYVQVELSNATDGTYANGATVVCNAASDAGTLTIPPYALLALPTGNSSEFAFAQRTAASFTASNLNLGVIETETAPISFGGVTLQ